MMTSDDADAINSASAEPVPEVGEAPNTIIRLIRGLREETSDGVVWHDSAEVRELTGEDEEYLASIENKKGLTYSEYMSALLARATVRIGGIQVNNEVKIVDKLILGDRDLLYLNIVRATYGQTRTIRMRCKECNESNDVEIDLDDDFPLMEHSFDPKHGIDVQTSKGLMTLRLPNGEDTVIVQKSTQNDAELNTAMIARCAEWSPGQEPSDREAWARRLSIADRRALVNALLSARVGPQIGEVKTQCAVCGEDMSIMLDWVSLLFG